MKHLSKIAFLTVIGAVTALSAAPEGPRLSAAEMSAKAQALVARQEEDYRQLLALKEKAKKQRDVIKLNCVNDKLVQVKAQMNIGEGQKTRLDAAISADRGAEASTLIEELKATADRVSRIRDEAVTCLGEPELFKQESGIQVEKPEIPDDPTVIDPTNVVDIEPPGYASPFN